MATKPIQGIPAIDSHWLSEVNARRTIAKARQEFLTAGSREERFLEFAAASLDSAESAHQIVSRILSTDIKSRTPADRLNYSRKSGKKLISFLDLSSKAFTAASLLFPAAKTIAAVCTAFFLGLKGVEHLTEAEMNQYWKDRMQVYQHYSQHLLTHEKGREILRLLKEKDTDFNEMFKFADLSREVGLKQLPEERRQVYQEISKQVQDGLTHDQMIEKITTGLKNHEDECKKILDLKNKPTTTQIKAIQDKKELLELTIHLVAHGISIKNPQLASDLKIAALGILEISTSCILLASKAINPIEFGVAVVKELTELARYFLGGKNPDDRIVEMLKEIHQNIVELAKVMEENFSIVIGNQKILLSQLEKIALDLSRFETRCMAKLEKIDQDLANFKAEFRAQTFQSEQNQLQTYYDRFLLRPDLKGGVQAGDFDLLSKVFNYAVRTSRTPVFSGNKAASSNEQTLSQEILSRKQVSAVFGLLTSIGKTQSLQTLPNPNTPNPLEWSRATALFIEMLSSGIVPSNDNLLLMLDQLDQAGEQVAEAIFLMSDPKVIRDLWKQCEDLLKDIIQGLPDVFLASALYTSCLDKPILIQGYACPQIECVAKPAPTFFPYPNPPSKAFMVNGVASFETPGYLWKENLPPNVKDAGGYFFRINDGKNNFNPVKTAVELGLIEIVRVNEIEGVSLNLGKFPSTGSSGNFISTDTVQTVEMRFLKEPLNGFRIPGKRHKVLIQDSAKPGDPGRIYEWDEWDWRESIASLQNLYAAQKLPFEPKVFPDIFDDKGNYKASPDNCLTFADFLTYQLNNHLEYRKAEFVSNSSQLVREKNKEKYDRFTVLSSYLNVCLNIHRQGQSHQANDAVLDIVAPTVEGAEKVEDKFQLLLKQNRKENIETTPVPNCPLLKRTVNNVLGTQSMEEFIKAKNLELSGSSNLGNQLNLQQDMIRRWSFIEDVRQQVMSWILAYDLPATRFYGMKPSELFRPFQVDEMQTLLLHHLPSSSECTILPPFPLFQYAPEEGEKKLKEHLAVYVRELKKDNQQALVLIQLGANHYAALLLQRKLGKIDANYFDVTEKSIPLSVAKVLTSLGTQPIKLADDTPLIEYNNPFASSMLIATLEKYIKDGKSSLPVNALLSLRKSKDLHLLSQRAIARKSPASTSFNPLRYNLGGLINLKYFHSSTATSLSNRAFWAGSLGFFGAVFGGLIGELFKKPEIGVGTGLLGLGLGSLVPGGQKEKDYATYKNDATTQFQVNNPLALEYANAALDIKEENPSDGTISNTRKEQLVMLYRLGYYDTFYKQLSDSLAKQADLKAALEDLAQYFEENDCWVPAFNCFRSILLIDPSNENIIYKHANYLFNFGRYAEIIDFINTNQGFVKDPVLAVTINELKINAEIKLKKSKA